MPAAPEQVGVSAGPERSIFEELETVVSRYLSASAAWRQKLGISATEWAALLHVVQAGALTGAELSRTVGMTTAAITTMADRLEKAELLQRIPDQSDRRQVLLYPTKKAVVTMSRLSEDLRGELANALAQSPTTHQNAIRGFLHTTSRLLERHTPPVGK